MNKFKTSLLAMIMGLALSLSFNANAKVINIVSGNYNFASGGGSLTGFSDNIAFNVSSVSDVVANITGTGLGFKLSAFDLYQGTTTGVSTKIATGGITNAGTGIFSIGTHSTGAVSSTGLLGDYFLKVSFGPGLGAYTGTIALTSPVPEASASAMLLAGLGLMGFVARRRKA